MCRRGAGCAVCDRTHAFIIFNARSVIPPPTMRIERAGSLPSRDTRTDFSQTPARADPEKPVSEGPKTGAGHGGNPGSMRERSGQRAAPLFLQDGLSLDSDPKGTCQQLLGSNPRRALKRAIVASHCTFLCIRNRIGGLCADRNAVLGDCSDRLLRKNLGHATRLCTIAKGANTAPLWFDWHRRMRRRQTKRSCPFR
jgi:hypothetical protein